MDKKEITQLEDAINHCKEVAFHQELDGCKECAEDHLQLATWLKELMEYKMQDSDLEKQIKEDKEEQLKAELDYREEQLKKLKAELDYAKFRCALPTIMNMMTRN